MKYDPNMPYTLPRTMNAGELIKVLSTVPEDTPVITFRFEGDWNCPEEIESAVIEHHRDGRIRVRLWIGGDVED